MWFHLVSVRAKIREIECCSARGQAVDVVKGLFMGDVAITEIWQIFRHQRSATNDARILCAQRYHLISRISLSLVFTESLSLSLPVDCSALEILSTQFPLSFQFSALNKIKSSWKLVFPSLVSRSFVTSKGKFGEFTKTSRSVKGKQNGNVKTFGKLFPTEEKREGKTIYELNGP